MPTGTSTPTPTTQVESATRQPKPTDIKEKEAANTSAQAKKVTLGGFSFDLPAGWTAKEKHDEIEPHNSRNVQLYDQNGEKSGYISISPSFADPLRDRKVDCDDATYYETVDLQNVTQFPAAPDAKDISATMSGKVFPRFVYRIVEDPLAEPGGRSVGKWAGSLSLTDHPAGEDNKTCWLNAGTGVFIPGTGILSAEIGGERQFGGRATVNTGPKVFNTKDEALAYMDSEEYKAAKQLLISLTVSATP